MKQNRYTLPQSQSFKASLGHDIYYITLNLSCPSKSLPHKTEVPLLLYSQHTHKHTYTPFLQGPTHPSVLCLIVTPLPGSLPRLSGVPALHTSISLYFPCLSTCQTMWNMFSDYSEINLEVPVMSGSHHSRLSSTSDSVLTAQSLEPALDSVSLSPAPAHTLSFSLSLSFSFKNKH